MNLPILRVRGASDASAGTPDTVAWPEGFDDFLAVGPTKADKNATPAWLPVTLRPGARRTDEGVALLHALVLDYDVNDRGIPAEDILERWAGYERVLHSTWTPGRWRVVIPYARPHTPEEHARVYAWAIAREGGLIDASCRNPSRLFFWPCYRSDLDVEPTFGYQEGELLDAVRVAPSPDLVRGPARVVTSSGSPSFANQSPPSPAREGRPDVEPVARGAAVAYSGITDAGQDRDLPLIESRCAFMARARDEAAALPEPEWYAALSVWSRCKNGDDLAHERSRPYAGYTPGETTEKLERAKAVGPATCAYVRSISPACRGCALQVTSPVLLGRVEPAAVAEDEDPREALAEAEAALEKASTERRAAMLAVEKAKRALRGLRQAGSLASDDDMAAAVAERADAEAGLSMADRVFKAREKAVAKLRQHLSATGLPAGADPATWQRLRLGPDNRPVDSVANVMHVLSAPEWARRLSYDTFSLDVLLDGKALPEEQAPRIAVALSDTYGLETSTPRIIECVRSVAVSASTHPVQEWLRGLRWDGVERVRSLAWAGFGVVQKVPEPWQTALLEEIGVKFLVSMVARALRPGCKMDTMLVLTGPQGAFKSTALERLVPNPAWFGRTKLDLMNKDSFMALRGKWLFEMAELSSMKKVEAAVSKGWLSNDKDTYRAPYARRSDDHPRQTVVPGTDNEGEFLVDATGHRRYWPVPTGGCFPEWVAEHREMLFAEAVRLFDTGTTWWFDEQSEMAEHLRRWSSPYVATHPWTETVVSWLRSTAGSAQYREFTPVDVMTRALAMDVGDLNTQDQHIVVSILRQLSCPRVDRDVTSGHSVAHFRRPSWLLDEKPGVVLNLRAIPLDTKAHTG
jgi:hypothetical protein